MTTKIDKKIIGYRVATPETKDSINVATETKSADVIHMHERVERPEMLIGSTYKVKTPENVSAHALYITINDIVLNQVLVSLGDERKTNRIIDELQRDGTCWCGGTVWQGKTAMRISTSNWSTTDDDVQKCLDVMIRIARSAS